VASLPIRAGSFALRRKAVRRALPIAWVLVAAEAAVATKQHWDRLPPGTRQRVIALLAKSKGKPSNLSAAEKKELRTLVRQLHLVRLGRDLAVVASPLRGKKKP
jgi:hypothetical protein